LSNIPLARELIAKAAGMLPAGDPARSIIMEALPMLMRERPHKRASITSRELTLEVACEIWRYYRRNPDAPTQQIATVIGVNAGRVSEVLTGTRFSRAKALSIRKPNQ